MHRFASLISAIAVICLGASVNAQQLTQKAQRYQVIGQDREGINFLLDTQDYGINQNTFSIFQIRPTQISKMTFQSSCAKRQLLYQVSYIYNSQGVLLNKTIQNEQVNLTPNTVAFNAMKYHCQALGTPGY